MMKIKGIINQSFYRDSGMLYDIMTARRKFILSGRGRKDKKNGSRIYYNLSTLLLMLYLLPVRGLFKMAALARIPTMKIVNRIKTSKEYYDNLQYLLHIGKVEGCDLVRAGAPHDGGYLMLDDFLKSNGIAYSFGIADEISWDLDMASRGYDVFMYDHTIDKLPVELDKLHFFKEGIADSDATCAALHSLEHYVQKNQHEECQNMILKMDVEGAEWGFLSMVDSQLLNQFDQIIFEFHDLNAPRNTEQVLSALKKINETHALIHLHPNNCANGIAFNGKIFHDVLEATYVSRKKYRVTEDYDVQLPLDLDRANDLDVPDVSLGYWNRIVDIDDNLQVRILV